MDLGLFLLLAFPIVWMVVAHFIWSYHFTVKEVALAILIVCICVSGAWYAGKYRDMADTEIRNGQVTAKKRQHGQYTSTYPCNCRTICSGKTCSTSCSVCTRQHYTVEWFLKTTVGNVTLEYYDRLSPAVYASSDPANYRAAFVGEPVAREFSYRNYIKAVPESLFHLTPQVSRFNELVPTYPRVYDKYKVNRVLTVETAIDPKPLNKLLNDALRALGPEKQVNIVVILTGLTDSNFKYAVENAWLAGKKNDVIVYIGVSPDGSITWADATIWVKNAGNEYPVVLIRDGLTAMGEYDVSKVAQIITSVVKKEYNRVPMETYAYLEDEIDPPLWAILLAIFLSIGGSLWLTYYFIKNEVFE